MVTRRWRYFDYALLAITVSLIGLGVLMIHSATANAPELGDLARRQLLYGLAGLALMFLTAIVDYRLLSSLSLVFYFVMLAILGAVFVAGQVLVGAQRWFDLGLSIQPSELAKLLTIIVLARFISDHEGEMGHWRYLLTSMAILLPPIVLIYLQPHLSAAIVLAAVGGVMIFVGGIRWSHIALIGLAGAGAAPALWFTLRGYMQERVLVFLNPASDPAASYNVEQALISIGSGGWLGKGLLRGSQSQLQFLRVRHADFIFSVIAEELGFVGSMVLLLLLGIMIWRLLRIAEIARDGFGRLLVVGYVTVVFLQSVINIGMNLRLLPATGIPLPFISHGGSALVTLLLGMGLAQSVAMRHRKIEF
jgi:rod shape determining protein RodA